MKLQSSFEYLMAYGWSALIITVALLALFESGAFGAASLYPVSLPGSCTVVRPQGQMSTQFISLSGTCSTGIPESVAALQCSWPNVAICNPNNIAINVNSSVNPVTFTVWFWEPPDYMGSAYGGVLVALNGSDPTLYIGGTGGQLCGSIMSSSATYCSPANIVPARWNYAVATMSSSALDVYLNGKLVASGPGASISNDIAGNIGLQACNCFFSGGQPVGDYDSGYLYNVQIYNTTLSAAEVNALYAEGIEGPPIDLSHLIGWWQLNSNANDYSGNAYDGKPYNITWDQNWKSTYVGQQT